MGVVAPVGKSIGRKKLLKKGPGGVRGFGKRAWDTRKRGGLNGCLWGAEVHSGIRGEN